MQQVLLRKPTRNLGGVIKLLQHEPYLAQTQTKLNATAHGGWPGNLYSVGFIGKPTKNPAV